MSFASPRVSPRGRSKSPRRRSKKSKKSKRAKFVQKYKEKAIRAVYSEAFDPKPATKNGKRKRRMVKRRKSREPKLGKSVETYFSKRRNRLLNEENRRMHKAMVERQKISIKARKREQSQRLKLIGDCKKRMANPYYTRGHAGFVRDWLLIKTGKPRASSAGPARQTRRPRSKLNSATFRRTARNPESDGTFSVNEMNSKTSSGIHLVQLYACSRSVPLMGPGDAMDGKHSSDQREMNVKLSDVQSRNSTTGISVELRAPGERPKHAFVAREILSTICSAPDLTPLQNFFRGKTGGLGSVLYSDPQLHAAFVNCIMNRLYLNAFTEKACIRKSVPKTNSGPEVPVRAEPSPDSELPRPLSPNHDLLVSDLDVPDPVQPNQAPEDPDQSNPDPEVVHLSDVESILDIIGGSDPDQSNQDPDVSNPPVQSNQEPEEVSDPDQSNQDPDVPNPDTEVLHLSDVQSILDIGVSDPDQSNQEPDAPDPETLHLSDVQSILDIGTEKGETLHLSDVESILDPDPVEPNPDRDVLHLSDVEAILDPDVSNVAPVQTPPLGQHQMTLLRKYAVRDIQCWWRERKHERDEAKQQEPESPASHLNQEPFPDPNLNQETEIHTPANNNFVASLGSMGPYLSPAPDTPSPNITLERARAMLEDICRAQKEMQEQVDLLTTRENEELDAEAATKLQALYRGFEARMAPIRKAAATKVQAMYRGRLAREAPKKEAATKLQAMYRGRLAREAPKKARKAAATKVQAMYRGRKVREAPKKAATKAAATKVQAMYRGRIAREASKDLMEVQQVKLSMCRKELYLAIFNDNVEKIEQIINDGLTGTPTGTETGTQGKLENSVNDDDRLSVQERRMLLNQSLDENVVELPLETATRFGVANSLLKLLELGADPKKCNALSLACRLGYVDIIDILVTHSKTDLTEPLVPETGETACHLLVSMHQDQALQEYAVLLKKYAKSESIHSKEVAKAFSACSADGLSPLHLAAILNYDLIIDVLLESDIGLDVNALSSRGETALIIATRCHNVQALKALLKFDADPNLRDYRGHTAMYYAACNGSVEDFYLLSEYDGAQLSPSAIERLLTFEDWVGVMHLCVENGWCDEMPTAEMQKEALETAENENMRIFELEKLLLEDDPDAHQEVLSAGAIVNEKEAETGDTLLHSCCRAGATKAVRFLVEKARARGDIRNNTGSTALIEAVRAQSLEIIDLILTRFPSSKNMILQNAENAVFVASGLGSRPVLERLLAAGCDCYQHRDDGMSCVMLASQKGHLEVLKELLRYGVDPAMQDASGRTAFDVAKTKEITKYLYEHADTTTPGDII